MSRHSGIDMGRPAGNNTGGAASWLRVRAMTAEDAPRISEMAAALSAHEGQPPAPFSADDVLRWGFGEEKRFDGLVAVSEEETIGYALYHDSFSVGLGTPGLHMLDLFVEDAARGRGAGRALIAQLSRICLTRGGSWLTWQALPNNAIAMDFYRAIGARRFIAANFELDRQGMAGLGVRDDSPVE